MLNFYYNLYIYRAIYVALLSVFCADQQLAFAQSPEPPKSNENNPEATAQAKDKPFELKGDSLGMSLKDFKIKHKREIVNGGDTIIIPRCANERTDEERQKTPNEAMCEEPWHAKANITNATLSVIFEDITENKFTPKLAGTKAYMHHYSFIDDQLFSIVYIMPMSGYADVKEALIETYGKFKSEAVELREDDRGNNYRAKTTKWINSKSTISFIDKVLDNEYCALMLVHDQLGKIALERRAKYNKKKL